MPSPLCAASARAEEAETRAFLHKTEQIQKANERKTVKKEARLRGQAAAKQLAAEDLKKAKKLLKSAKKAELKLLLKKSKRSRSPSPSGSDSDDEGAPEDDGDEEDESAGEAGHEKGDGHEKEGAPKGSRVSK